MLKKVGCFILSATLLISLVACGNSETPPANTQSADPQNSATTTKDSVIVAMGTGSEPETGFDPAFGWGAGEHMHEPLIQSTLTITTQDLKITYDLATDLSVSDDGMLWTAKIRDDVSFTDGETLTAYDVAFTYNKVKELSTINDFTMLERAEATDDTTVLFHMARPFAIWPYSMAIVGIVPEHAYGPDYGQNPIGSGRYVLKQWDKGQQVIFEANPDYYGETPKMKRVTILFMSEDAAFAAVQAGQVDVAATSAPYSDQTIAGYSLLAAQTVDNRGFSMPNIPFDGEKGNNVTSDPAIRQALNIGIDREGMIVNVLNGYGTPAYSVCDKMPWFNEGMIVEYDRTAAIKMLEDAGWAAESDGIRSKNGTRAELIVMYPSSDPVRQALAADAVNQMKELGIAATLEGLSFADARLRAGVDLMTWGYGSHTPMELYNLYHSDPETGGSRYAMYQNPTVDSYIDQALAVSTLEDSYELWKKAQWDGQTGLAEDVPWLWLVNIDHLFWTRNELKVAEQKLHPHGHGWSIVNNVDQWFWQ